MDVVHIQIKRGTPQRRNLMTVLNFFYVLAVLFSDAVTNNCLVFDLFDGKRKVFASLIFSFDGAKLVTEKGAVFFPATTLFSDMRERILTELDEYMRWNKNICFEYVNGFKTIKIDLSGSFWHVHGSTYLSDDSIMNLWKEMSSCETIKDSEETLLQ